MAVLKVLKIDLQTGAQEFVDVAAGDTPPPPDMTVSQGAVSRRQFAQGLAKRELISLDEALAWAGQGQLPTAVKQFVATLPEEQQFDATITLMGAHDFSYNHPLVSIFATAVGYGQQQLEEFWQFCTEL